MSLKPARDHLLVQVVEQKEKLSKWGLFLGTDSSEDTREAVVVAVGEPPLSDGVAYPTAATVGQRVLISKFGGVTLQDGDNSYLLITNADVLATIEPD